MSTSRDPKEWAEALTARDLKAFSALDMNELINLRNLAPSATQAIKDFNKLSEFVKSDIMQDDNLYRTVQDIEKWINIAHYMAFEADPRNYNAVNAISGALNSTTVFNLLNRSITKAGVQLLSETANEKFNRVRDLVSQEKNFKNLRTAIEENQNSLPFLGMYMTDLTFAHDCNKIQTVEEIQERLKTEDATIVNNACLSEKRA